MRSRASRETVKVPSDTKVLLTKNYSEILLFQTITNFTRNSVKKPFFPGDFELSDPRNRKSLAIANRNFEVASFSRRNRNEIAILQVFLESQ